LIPDIPIFYTIEMSTDESVHDEVSTQNELNPSVSPNDVTPSSIPPSYSNVAPAYPSVAPGYTNNAFFCFFF
jgi:hypothetical protein